MSKAISANQTLSIKSEGNQANLLSKASMDNSDFYSYLQIADELYNCSTPYSKHWISVLSCDMVINCDGHQDEVLCEYQTDQCGQDSIQAGDKCWTVVKNTNITSWDQAYDECQSRGQTLLNLPSITDIGVMFRLINLANSNTNSEGLFTGLHTTQRPKQTPLLTWMYSKSLFWSDKSVAANILYPRYGVFYVFQKEVCGYLYKHRYDVELDECGTNREIEGNLTVVCERPIKDQSESSRSSINSVVIAHLNHSITIQNRNRVKDVKNKLFLNTKRCSKGHYAKNYLACSHDSNCGVQLHQSSCPQGEHNVPMFQCSAASTHTVHYTDVCNYEFNCPDKSDESFCTFDTCPLDSVHCSNGECVPIEELCSGAVFCLDASDQLMQFCDTDSYFIRMMPAPNKIDYRTGFKVQVGSV